MQEFPSVRVDSTANIISRFLRLQKESNIAITGGSCPRIVAFVAYFAYAHTQIKVVEELVYQIAYPAILGTRRHHRGFQLRVSSRSLRYRPAINRSDAKGEFG